MALFGMAGEPQRGVLDSLMELARIREPSGPMFAAPRFAYAGGNPPMLPEGGYAPPAAGPAPPERGPERRGNFFDRIGRGIGQAAGNGELRMRLLMAQAIANGDHAGAARISMGLQEMRQRQAQAQAAGERRESMFNNLVKQGMDPGDAELAMSNPEAFGTEFNTRFRTREASAGESIYRPGFAADAAPNVWTAPTQAEQDAESLGLAPGAQGYETFMRDRTLGAQGPTAVGLARDRITTTQRGQDIASRDRLRGQDLTDARGRRGQGMASADRRRAQDLADARGRRGQDMTDARGRRAQDLRNPIARNPQTGQRLMLRGRDWVPIP